MGIRIWHQSFAVLEHQPGYAAALGERVGGIVRPDTEIVFHGQIPGTFSTSYPGADLEYSFFWWIHGLQWVAAALEAQRQGFDAMVLATIQSPMVQEIRTLVDIPVVGYGDGAFNLAGLYGRRSGLLIFDTTRSESWPDQLRQWGLAERFAGVEQAGVKFQEVVGCFADSSRRAEVVGRIVAAGERFAAEKRVDVIIPGQMPMNLLLAMSGVTEIGGATVMDGLATCFKLAETLVDLRRVAGMKQSRRGYFHAGPNPARIEEVLRFYGLEELGRRIPTAPLGAAGQGAADARSGHGSSAMGDRTRSEGDVR